MRTSYFPTLDSSASFVNGFAPGASLFQYRDSLGLQMFTNEALESSPEIIDFKHYMTYIAWLRLVVIYILFIQTSAARVFSRY
jgi:hypothetical protein